MKPWLDVDDMVENLDYVRNVVRHLGCIKAEDVEDIVNDVVVKILELDYLKGYNALKASFNTYIFCLVRSCWADHFKHKEITFSEIDPLFYEFVSRTLGVKDDMEYKFYVEEHLKVLEGQKPWGFAIWDGQVVKKSCAMIYQMLVCGKSLEEIARMFGEKREHMRRRFEEIYWLLTGERVYGTKVGS